MELRGPVLDRVQLGDQRPALRLRDLAARFQIGFEEPGRPVGDLAIGYIGERYKTVDISELTFVASGDFSKSCQIAAIEGQQITPQIADRRFQAGASFGFRMKRPVT